MKIGLRLSLVLLLVFVCLRSHSIKANENTKIRVDKVENLSSDFYHGDGYFNSNCSRKSGVEYKDEMEISKISLIF